MKILLAEDDRNLGKLLAVLLKKQGISVDWVEDGQAAYDRVYTDSYDVLVLDWMMPKMDGVKLCSLLREEEYEGKIIMLTARDAVADRVSGLNSGADDYLVKPFELEELVARLNALCRRQSQYTAANVAYGDYVLEEATYCLVCDGRRVELRPREFKLLKLLLLNKGRVLPRALLQDRVWGIDSDVSENNLDVHIRLLRLHGGVDGTGSERYRYLAAVAPVMKDGTLVGNQLALLASDKAISLECCVEERLLVYGDERSLTRLLIILLDNALKYSSAGTTVALQAEGKEKKAILRVMDEGIGISAADKERIFDRFYRVDKARSRASGGFGLGLSLAQAIVQQHGGSIEVRDNEPQGTVMQVSLPLRRES